MRKELLRPEVRNPLTINVNRALVDRVKAKDYVVIDIETDGLMYDYTKIWVLCVYDPKTNETAVYTGEDLTEGVKSLQGRILVGHNILKFDLPILMHLYTYRGLSPAYIPSPAQCLDTLVMSRLGNPDRPGGHALASWGERLSMPKQEHDDWTHLSPEMISRCSTDCALTNKVFEVLLGELTAMPMAVEIEHSVAYQTGLVERQGILLDVPYATKLLCEMTLTYDETLRELQKLWPTRIVSAVAKGKDNHKSMKSVTKRSALYGMLDPGIEYCPIVTEEFTGSRRQAADRLTKQYGWKPKKFSDGGVAEISEETLSELPFPEAKLLLTLYDLEKKIAFLKSKPDRKKLTGWLDVVHSDDRLRCSLNYNGAYTHRMACSNPNLQQVSTEGPMRSCFIASPGWVLVGVDAKSLELRTLAHYVAKYDGGKWAAEVLQGDPHTSNQLAMGAWSRGTAKRIIYASPYGAGDTKLGSIWLVDDKGNYIEDCAKTKGDPNAWSQKWEVLGLKPASSKAEIGKAIKRLPLFGAVEKVKIAGKAAILGQGWVPGLDGRKVRSSKEHTYSVIATLCQSAGAVIMKAAIYLCPATFAAEGLVYGRDYRFVLYVHDEFQIEARPECVEKVKAAGIEAIQLAGELLRCRLPMDGDAKHGYTWKDTH